MQRSLIRFPALIALAALSACQATPPGFKVDPALKTASVPTLRAKVADACIISQRARSSASTGELRSKCGCYASATLKAMDAEEMTFYRTNGYFSEATRQKGSAALASCKLAPV